MLPGPAAHTEYRLNGWQGWDHTGGCLKTLKKTEKFSLPEINRWFHGHRAHSTTFLYSQQSHNKYVTTRSNSGFSVIQSQINPISYITHILCQIMLNFPSVCQPSTSIFNWAVNSGLCTTFSAFSFSELQSPKFMKTNMHSTCPSNLSLPNLVTLTWSAQHYTLLLTAVHYQRQ